MSCIIFAFRFFSAAVRVFKLKTLLICFPESKIELSSQIGRPACAGPETEETEMEHFFTHGHRTLFRRAAICTLVLGMIFLAGMAGGCRAFAEPAGDTESAVNFNRTLDAYVPQKDRYNFYFTYKIVHPWWDAVAMGIEDAQRQYLDRGIAVTYEYMAPAKADAEDQRMYERKKQLKEMGAAIRE